MYVLLDNGYDLGKDHEMIKQQVKVWELSIDQIIADFYQGKINVENAINELENISQEMMAINI